MENSDVTPLHFQALTEDVEERLNPAFDCLASSNSSEASASSGLGGAAAPAQVTTVSDDEGFVEASSYASPMTPVSNDASSSEPGTPRAFLNTTDDTSFTGPCTPGDDSTIYTIYTIDDAWSEPEPILPAAATTTARYDKPAAATTTARDDWDLRDMIYMMLSINLLSFDGKGRCWLKLQAKLEAKSVKENYSRTSWGGLKQKLWNLMGERTKGRNKAIFDRILKSWQADSSESALRKSVSEVISSDRAPAFSDELRDEITSEIFAQMDRQSQAPNPRRSFSRERLWKWPAATRSKVTETLMGLHENPQFGNHFNRIREQIGGLFDVAEIEFAILTACSCDVCSNWEIERYEPGDNYNKYLCRAQTDFTKKKVKMLCALNELHAYGYSEEKLAEAVRNECDIGSERGKALYPMRDWSAIDIEEVLKGAHHERRCKVCMDALRRRGDAEGRTPRRRQRIVRCAQSQPDSDSLAALSLQDSPRIRVSQRIKVPTLDELTALGLSDDEDDDNEEEEEEEEEESGSGSEIV